MNRFSRQKQPAAEANKLLSSKLKWILAGRSPTRVIGFGAVACGELTDDSDVDFAVLFHSVRALTEGDKTPFASPRDDDRPHKIFSGFWKLILHVILRCKTLSRRTLRFSSFFR